MSERLEKPEVFAAPIGGAVDLLIVAGEHSGDEHAAQVLRDLKAAQPELQVACLGGVELEAAGAQLLYELTAVSIVGFVEVAKHYGFFKALFERTLDWIEQYRPKHICFVDYPGLNLRLADQLRERGLSKKGGGEIGISFYIGPQIWAWKAKRRFKMERVLDRVGVIFPFEVDCYKDTQLPVEFVGHPFVRENYDLPFHYDSAGPVLLLPGSRRAAVEKIFPLLLSGFEQALKKKPDLKACVVYPSDAILELLHESLRSYPKLGDKVDFVENGGAYLPASAVLMSSGTMSLAVALSGVPGAIAYRLNTVSYWIGRMLVKIPYIGISNLLLERPLNPEYIQGAATAEALAAELLRAVGDVEAQRAAQEGAEQLRALLQPDSNANAADWLSRAMSGG